MESFGPYGDLIEEQVVSYLRRLKALRGSRGDRRVIEVEEGEGEGEEGEEGEGKGVPCEVCGRRYPHEHVKSLYTTRGDDADEGDDG